MSTDPTDLRATSSPLSTTDAPADVTGEGTMRGRRERLRETTPDPAPNRRPAPGPRSGSKKRPPRRKRKVRKVHRVVRHLEVWSVLKMSAAFAACGYVIAMISGFLLWQAADRVGTINGIEGFMEDSGGYDNFEILGGVVFRSAAVIGLVLVGLTVAGAVLAAVLFNLISDLTGGIRMTVIDEDLIVAPVRRPGGRPNGPGPAAGPRQGAEPTSTTPARPA